MGEVHPSQPILGEGRQFKGGSQVSFGFCAAFLYCNHTPRFSKGGIMIPYFVHKKEYVKLIVQITSETQALTREGEHGNDQPPRIHSSPKKKKKRFLFVHKV